MTEKIDLDKELGLSMSSDGIPTKEINMLGRTWHVLCDVNSYTLTKIGGGDANQITAFLGHLVIEDEREDFEEALMAVHGLDGEKLVGLVTRLIEVASERPTAPPSSSSPSAKSRVSGRKSTAVSSSARAAG